MGLIELVCLKNGDVFEIETLNGFAFFQYVHKDEVIGSLIRILPNLYVNSNKDILEELVTHKELYFIHFPLVSALKQRIVTKMGNYSMPQDFLLPQKFRSKHLINGEFISWHIVDYKTWKRENIEKLTNEQMELSPWGTWNDTLLKDRLAEGWTLDNWI